MLNAGGGTNLSLCSRAWVVGAVVVVDEVVSVVVVVGAAVLVVAC